MDASVRLIELVLPATVALQATVPAEHPSAQILGTERSGSGVLIDPDGLVLTVNYVVLGAESVEVTLLDETTKAGKVVAQDYATGVAVIDIGRNGQPPLKPCRSSELQVGQEIFIVAADDGNQRRASNGGVMSLGPFDAYWEYSLDRAIVTTAVNPGLGGGPLLDTLGRVAGIVSLDLGEVGRFTLAIPIESYLDHRDELLRHGRRVSRPSRAWIGFYCFALRDHVVVAGVLPGAPGDQAGLKAGDVVLAVDDHRLGGRHELYRQLWSHRSGEPIRLEIFRDHQVTQVTVQSGNAEEFFA